MSEDEENHSAFEKLSMAQDHLERADALREEAKDDLETVVKDALPFSARVSVEYNKETQSFTADVSPLDLRKLITEATPEYLHLLGANINMKFRFFELIEKDVEEFTGDSQEPVHNVRQIIQSLEDETEEGAPIPKVVALAQAKGLDPSKTIHEIDKLKRKGEAYEPRTDYLRTT